VASAHRTSTAYVERLERGSAVAFHPKQVSAPCATTPLKQCFWRTRPSTRARQEESRADVRQMSYEHLQNFRPLCGKRPSAEGSASRVGVQQVQRRATPLARPGGPWPAAHELRRHCIARVCRRKPLAVVRGWPRLRRQAAAAPHTRARGSLWKTENRRDVCFGLELRPGLYKRIISHSLASGPLHTHIPPRARPRRASSVLKHRSSSTLKVLIHSCHLGLRST
jgi:hypothetical protein